MKYIFTLVLIGCMQLSYGQSKQSQEDEIKNNDGTALVVIIPKLLPTIVTDRPDVTESAMTIPKGFLQIETGALYSNDEESGIETSTFVYNTSLLRYGISDNFEFRLISNALKTTQRIEQLDIESSVSGLDVITLGTKISFTFCPKLFDNTAILGHLSLNKVASPEFRTATPAHNVIFSGSKGLSDNLSLGINLGAGWDGFAPEIAGLYSVSLGVSVSDRFGIYAEAYGDWPQTLGMSANFDAGITYLANNQFQLDLSGGTGITEGTTDYFVSAGLSYIFRLHR